MTGESVRDAALKVTKAMPTADAAISTGAIDVGAVGTRDDFLAGCELLISAPALNTTMLPNADTATYKVMMDDDVALGSALPVYGSDVLVQTGAGGAGADAVTKRVRLPSDVERYVFVTATLAGGTGDASATTLTVELLV